MGAMHIAQLSRVATLVFVGVALYVGVIPVTLGAADDAPTPRVDPDREVPDDGPGMPRGVAQILVGSAGFEPGIAAEWRWRSEPAMQVRPELSINDNGRVGAAVSLSWGLRSSSNDRFALPGGSDIFIGPRVAFHNRDVDGWEVGAIGIYSLALDPYFRAPQIILAMPRRFLPLRTFYPEMEALKTPGLSDGIFMSSRDGVAWNRFEEAFIRPGLDARNWVHRANTPARGIVPTGSDEISIYVERNYTFPSNRLERMTLRTDGFVSIHAGVPGGEMVTRPLLYVGGDLVLNCATAASGGIRIEIQDAAGRPIQGFRLEDAPEIFGDAVERTVDWGRTPGSRPLACLAGTPVRLRFVMRDADLYSLKFQ